MTPPPGERHLDRLQHRPVGSDSYTKNVFTGLWEKDKTTSGAGGATGAGGAGAPRQVSNLDPAAFTDLLKYLTVELAFADTDVNGAHVHHYRVKLDPEKLKAELSRQGVIADTRTSRFFDDFVKNGKYTVELWVGASDHLVRRLALTFDAITDAGTLGGFSIAGATSSGPAPTTQASPQPVHVRAHAQLDYSDFNTSIQITAPPSG